MMKIAHLATARDDRPSNSRPKKKRRKESSARDAQDQTIGKRIRARRREQGLRQSDLAKHLNITFQQVQKYESGRNRVSASRLLEIADFFKTDVAYFFEKSGGSSPDGSASLRKAMEAVGELKSKKPSSRLRSNGDDASKIRASLDLTPSPHPDKNSQKTTLDELDTLQAQEMCKNFLKITNPIARSLLMALCRYFAEHEDE